VRNPARTARPPRPAGGAAPVPSPPAPAAAPARGGPPREAAGPYCLPPPGAAGASAAAGVPAPPGDSAAGARGRAPPADTPRCTPRRKPGPGPGESSPRPCPPAMPGRFVPSQPTCPDPLGYRPAQPDSLTFPHATLAWAQKKWARQCLLKALPSPFALVEVPSLVGSDGVIPPEEKRDPRRWALVSTELRFRPRPLPRRTSDEHLEDRWARRAGAHLRPGHIVVS